MVLEHDLTNILLAMFEREMECLDLTEKKLIQWQARGRSEGCSRREQYNGDGTPCCILPQRLVGEIPCEENVQTFEPLTEHYARPLQHRSCDGWQV